MIDSASGNIDVLMYIWEDDELGRGIAEHLAAAAAAKRRVRVLVDGGANLIFAPSPATDPQPGSPPSSPSRQEKPKTAAEVNGAVCWLAQQPCVELIRIRNPCAHFDHRKLVLIDGKAAWAGGRNFTQPGFFVRHDLSLTMQGPLVTQLQEGFEEYWCEQGGKPSCIQNVRLESLTYGPTHKPVSSKSAPSQHSLRQAPTMPLIRLRSFGLVGEPVFDRQRRHRQAGARHGVAASMSVSCSPSSPIPRRSITPTR